MKFLNESNGNPSSMRIVTFIWVAGTFLVWAGAAIITAWQSPANFTFPTLPSEIVMIVLGMITGKVAQKGFEKKNS